MTQLTPMTGTVRAAIITGIVVGFLIAWLTGSLGAQARFATPTSTPVPARFELQSLDSITNNEVIFVVKDTKAPVVPSCWAFVRSIQVRPYGGNNSPAVAIALLGGVKCP